MAVKFKRKTGKPHIRLTRSSGTSWILSPVSHAFDRKLTAEEKRLHNLAYDYCVRVNPHDCKSKGEAARELHYGSEKK